MKKFRISLAIFIVVGLIIPAIFTISEMGYFDPKPSVQIHNTVTDSDLPPLRVVADFDFSPYTFYDEKGDISGLDVELINEIANRLGRKAEISFNDWISCKKAVQNNEAELILGLEIFSNMTGVLKTVAASSDDLAVFGKEKIFDVAALKGKKVGLIGNSVIEKILDLNCEYVPLFTNTQILEAIEAGTIDFGICHGSVARKIIEKQHYDIFQSVVLMKSYPAIGVRDDLVELRNQINVVLQQMSNEGFIRDLDEKWLDKFTRTPSVRRTVRENAKFYEIYFSGFICFLFGLIILFVQAYHKERAYKASIDYQNAIIKQMELQRISNIDELTQIGNRRAFENKLTELIENNITDVTVFAFDVNGLKPTNDNIGHSAGDELIRGAADCIKEVFSEENENCYRTGGDEFVAIITGTEIDAEALREKFKTTVSNWHGTQVRSMTISTGSASSKEVESYSADMVTKLLEMADKKMYSDKAQHYRTSGIDRRSR